ncbi:hypothetical protein ACQCX5_12545 [Propionibacteriaceae bacterium G57]|uniref:hypothetical protein n=1 Tax=Aestuariimicrobium sp. G57 TaxID=3418485 RepID=UPI003DA72334
MTTTQNGNGLAGLLQTASTVLADGKLDASDIPAAGSGVLGFLGVDIDAGGAAGQSPLGQLLQLVVSKIDFLAKPLEKLLGSAELVQQQSQAWVTVGQSFTEAGQDYAGGAADLPQWTGSAATAYTEVREAATPIFGQAAQGAQSMSMLVVKAGEMVATVRAFIWDILATYIGQVVQAALSALAAAIPSFGSSIAAFATWFIGSTATMAQKFFAMLQKLLKAAAEFGKALVEESQKLRQSANSLGQFSGALARA